MTTSLHEMIPDFTFSSVGDSDSSITPTTLSTSRHSQTLTNYTSVPHGCMEVNFNELGFLPWDNPDNIVSVEVERATARIKDTILLPILFVVGGPANVINMAVFYKQGLTERVNLCLFVLSFADAFYLILAMFLNGEQIHLQFTTKDDFGPIKTFMANNNLVGLYGFTWVSQILSAIIASERCLCVTSPLKFHTLLKTQTMAGVIAVVTVLVVGPYFFVASRYRVKCVFDHYTGTAFNTVVESDFYYTHRQAINALDGFVYGAGIPGVVIIVVTTTTIITSVKLKQVVTWRAGTSSAISAREVALTKMLIGSSVLFITCVTPIAVFRFVWLFLPHMNSGRRHQNFFLTSLWILETASYINSSFNIFVYYTMGSRYRDTFWALFRRKSKPEKREH